MDGLRIPNSSQLRVITLVKYSYYSDFHLLRDKKQSYKKVLLERFIDHFLVSLLLNDEFRFLLILAHTALRLSFKGT